MGSRGAPRPIPKCRPRPKPYVKDPDVEYLERIYERNKLKLESRVIELSKRWHHKMMDYVNNPNSELHNDILQSSYYLLDDAIVDLIGFEESN